SFEYGELQVEHVIPQSWREHWPVMADNAAERILAEQARDQHVNRLGNLTLANGHLNPAMSNDPWNAKRGQLQKHSKLELNARLVVQEHWDEDCIRARGRELAGYFERVWPGPASSTWDAIDPNGC